MARGEDTSRHPGRQVGGASTPAMKLMRTERKDSGSPQSGIKVEKAKQEYMFGGRVGTEDSGERGHDNRLSDGASATSRSYSQRQAPINKNGPGHFFGQHNSVIQHAQMKVNTEQAMPGLMQPPPASPHSMGTKLVDHGMGRESDGVERPVKVTKDPSIMRKPG